jgi:hypothetical protein
LNRKKARNTLGVTEPVFNALVRSGLLGYTSSSGLFADHAIRSYQQFGTQWSIDESYGPTVRVLEASVYESLPSVEGIGPQPPATQTHGFIFPADNTSSDFLEHARKNDTGWIAHFYLVPNYFYFPNLTEFALVGEPLLKLSGPRSISGAGLPVTLYPHPAGCLGLVVVEGWDRSWRDAHEESYNVVMPLLDELSGRYGVSLPVVHSMAVGVPSGLIHLYYSHRPREKRIEEEAEIQPRCPHPELKDAYALYREAVSSNNPFHAFLAFWKVYEEAAYVRQGWRQKHRRSDIKVTEEILPDLFTFGALPEELETPPQDQEIIQEMLQDQLRGKKFERAKDLLRGPYRAALAHAGKVDAGKPLTGASYEDYEKVAVKVPIVRYMSNVILENVRATFDADAERENGEA